MAVVSKIRTVGELKAALRKAGAVYVWVNLWQGDGDWVEVGKKALLRAIGAEVAFHRDGRHPHTEFRAEVRDDGDIYVPCYQNGGT